MSDNLTRRDLATAQRVLQLLYNEQDTKLREEAARDQSSKGFKLAKMSCQNVASAMVIVDVALKKKTATRPDKRSILSRFASALRRNQGAHA